MFREADILCVNAVRPDYVGFVIDFPKSKRSLTRERVAQLSSQVDDRIVRVGVFVDEPQEFVAELFDAGTIDVAQLHGHEDEEYIARLRAITDVRIWQAFQVRDAAATERARASSADMVVVDAGQGTGRVFDWSLVQGLDRDFILAGGLGPDNVAAAIEQVRPWGVDMSSGIETDGVKDPEKMRAAVAAARKM
jgi:phosphoribosylanthranilate isomerase